MTESFVDKLRASAFNYWVGLNYDAKGSRDAPIKVVKLEDVERLLSSEAFSQKPSGKTTIEKTLVWLVWEQSKDWLSLRDICSEEWIAERDKVLVKNEYTKAKQRNIFVEKTEMNHLHGHIEMNTIGQEEKIKENIKIRDLETQLKLLKTDYDKAVQRIKFLEEAGLQEASKPFSCEKSLRVKGDAE